MPDDKITLQVNVNIEMRTEDWQRIVEWAQARHPLPNQPGLPDEVWREIILEGCMTILWPGVTPMPPGWPRAG